jgi:hypothetical protein
MKGKQVMRRYEDANTLEKIGCWCIGLIVVVIVLIDCGVIRKRWGLWIIGVLSLPLVFESIRRFFTGEDL